jgi:hypothetical protein
MMAVAGAVVSTTKRAVVASETLPAVSVWRTSTVLAPAVSVAGAVANQEVPPSVLYSMVAAVSVSVTLNVPSLVIVSDAELPASVVNATVGAAMVVSKVKVSVVASETLPATSV